MANDLHTDSLIANGAKRLTPEDRPEKLLAMFIAACISDLFSESSRDQANFDRIALGLENGSDSLQHLARAFRLKGE